MQNILDQFKENLESAEDFLREELLGLRTGRATTGLVENVMIDYYGTKTPLKQLATINISEARMLIVEPYDKGSMKSVEKAISESEMGLTTKNDGKIIRVIIPPLNEERRKEMVKILSQKLEEARIAARNYREEAWKEIKGQEESGTLTQDDKYKAQEKLNDLINDFNSKIEEVGKRKEEKIMTV